MGVCNSTYIIQEKISKLFKGFDMVRAYIYEIIVMTKIDFKGNLNA